MQLIYVPFGYLFQLCYKVFGPYANYGLAIILFTLITKILTYPFALKQQKNSIEMARLKPKIDELNKKYGKDKLKLSEETQKLYKEENFSPFSGCLSTLIQLPILFGLYGVINAPLTYILRIDKSIINKAAEVLNLTANTRGTEIAIMNRIEEVRAAVPEVADKIGSLNLEFGMLDFGLRPSMSNFNALWIIPLFACLTAFLSGYVSQKANPAMQTQGSTGKAMLYTLPLISLLIAFSMPAGIGFYWGVSNIFMVLQTLITNHFYNFNKITAIEQAKLAVKRREYEEEVKNKISYK